MTTPKCMCIALLTAIPFAVSGADNFDLVRSAVATGGGHIESSGHCRTLDAAIAPAAAPSTGGSFTLSSGFLAGSGDTNVIFRDNFEECL